MNKNLRFILICLFLSNFSLVYSQNPVPNPSFENWTSGNPDGWLTTNAVGFAVPITQTSPSYSGALALKGEVVSTAAGNFPPILNSTDMTGNGFPVSQQFGTFSFYYKFNRVGAASFYAIVAIEDGSGSGIGGGGVGSITPTTSYTLASSPIYYSGGNPAEGFISFSIADTSGGAAPALGNYFIIDDVSLSGTVGVEEHTSLSLKIEKVQPNPANGISFIYYALAATEDVQFTLYDVTGKKYKEFLLPNEIVGRHKVELDVTDVPAGFYLLQMQSATGISTAAVQVAR